MTDAQTAQQDASEGDVIAFAIMQAIGLANDQLHPGSMDATASREALCACLAMFIVKSPHSQTIAGRRLQTDVAVDRLKARVREAAQEVAAPKLIIPSAMVQ